MHADVGMERLERVDGVREAEFFPHALEHARAHAATQKGAEEDDGVSQRIFVAYGGAADDDVRLRALARDMSPPRRFSRGRRHHEAGGVARLAPQPPGALERCEQRVMLDVAGRGHDQLAGMIGAPVERLEVRCPQRGHRVASAEDGVTVGMLTPERVTVQLEHEVVGRIVDHRDLLEHHLPLEVEIRLAQQRRKDEVPDDVGGNVEVLVEDAGLVHGVFTRCIGVERSTERLEFQRDLLGRAPRRALEHHVLEQMRDAHPVARLVQRGGADPGPERDRPHTRHSLREYGQSIGQHGAAESVHRRVTAVH